MHNRFDDISEYLLLQAEQQDQIASLSLCSNVIKMTFDIQIFILTRREYCDDKIGSLCFNDEPKHCLFS